MALDLKGPAGIYAGLDALNLTAKSWDVQFDGGKDTHSVVGYGHGVNGSVIWLRFTVVQDGVNTVLEGEWDLASDTQTLKQGTTVAGLQTKTQKPFKGKPYIEPGIDSHGSHVWFRFGEGTDKTKEYRFQTSVHVDLGKIGDLIKLLGVI